MDYYTMDDPWDNPQSEVEHENIAGENLREDLNNENNG